MTFVAASSQYLEIPASTDLHPAGPLTAMAWVNLTNTGAWQTILGTLTAGNVGSYWIGLINEYFAFAALNPATDVVYGGSIIVRDTGLHHVSAAFDNTDVKFYVDGDLVATVTTGFAFVQDTTNNPVYIGGFGAYYFANGDIHDVRLYNRIVTPEEHAEIYSARGTDRIHRGCVMRHLLAGPLEQVAAVKADVFGNHIATPSNSPTYQATPIGRPA